MGAIHGIIKGIDWINGKVGIFAAWLSIIMVVIVTLDVIFRYLFNISFVFVQELEWHLFGALFLIGAGYTLLHDSHVRVDIFYQHLGDKAKAWVNFLGVLVFLIPGCVMLIDTSWQFVANSFAIMEGSPDPGGIPYRFILKSFIPVGFVLVLLQGISMGLKSFLEIIGKPCPTCKVEDNRACWICQACNTEVKHDIRICPHCKTPKPEEGR